MLDPKGLEAAHKAAWSNKFATSASDDKHRTEAAITAYLATASAEAICWLPTKTIEWLETYDGPACGTETIAHNRPIKTDGGVPLYLAPRSPEASPAVTVGNIVSQIAIWSDDEGLDLSYGQGDDLARRILSALSAHPCTTRSQP